MSDNFVGGFRTYATGEQSVAVFLWDTNSLSWVPQTASTGSGGSVNVTNSFIPAQQYGTWNINSITNPVAVTGSFYQANQPVTVTNSVPVTGSFYQATQPVSIADTVPVSAAALETLISAVQDLNSTMLVLMSAMLEKMPRVTGNDQAAVSVESGTLSTVNTVNTVTSVTGLTNITNIGGKQAAQIPDALSQLGALHLYNNIKVSYI